MKPVILITASVVEDERSIRVARAYTEAVESAGGIAVIPDVARLDNISRLLEFSDGILLSGGVDVDPVYFCEQPIKELGEVSPMRDRFEIELINQAASQNKPILAICRGAQVLNVAFGGKVFQDIYSQIKEPVIKHFQNMPKHYASHSVRLAKGSKIRKIIKAEEIRTNSFHHQAVSTPGKGICVTATASDGVIEAIEHLDLEFCLGIQWHPEHMIHREPEQFEIFYEFVGTARNNIQKKV